jgi:hypothetical protein
MRRLGIVAVGLGIILLGLACGDEGEQELPRSLATAEAEPRTTLTSGERELEARVQDVALGLEDLPSGFTLEYDYPEVSGDPAMYIAHYSNTEITGDGLLEGSDMFAVTILVLLFDLEIDAQASYHALSARTAEQIMATGREQRHWPADLASEEIQQLAVDAHTIPLSQIGEQSTAMETSETFRLDSQELTMVDRGVLFKRGRVLCLVDVTASQRPPSTETLRELALRQDERISGRLP